MLNFGHSRQTPHTEGLESTGLPSSSSIRAGKAFGPPQRAAKRFAAVNRPHLLSLFPGTFPAPSAPLSGPRCLRRSAGHSGRACCPEVGSPPRQTVAFRFYHNFRKNTNPNPSPCRNAGSAQAFSHRAPHKRPAENPGRFERGSILAQSSLGLIHSFSARPCIILTAA